MKKYKKLFFIGISCLALIVSGFFLVKNIVKKVDAAVPSNYTQDATYDEISVTDLTFNGKTNQTIIRNNEDVDIIFNKTNENGSLIFKFKYDVKDTTNSDSNAFRVHFDVADDKWDSTNSVWFRGDGTYLNCYDVNQSKFSWNKKTALTAGLHEIEFGRIALFENGTLSGKYYVYYKVDGVEINSCINPYDLSKMDGSMFFNFSKGNTQNKVYDISYVSGYEAPDRITVSDLKNDNSSVGQEIYLNEVHKYTYDATAEHKSVVFNFVYDCKDSSKVSCQIHFSDDWIKTGGVIWLRNDNTFIAKEGSGYSTGKSPFTKNGVYQIEAGKLYITSGNDTGKYYIYVKANGVLLTEYIAPTMPDIAAVFTTGTNKDYIYDTKYMPVDLSSDLYLYRWDVKNSGMEFTASLRKDLVDLANLSEVGFVLSPCDNPSETTIVNGKLVNNGNNYLVKTAITAFDNDSITREYNAKFYYVMTRSTGAKYTYYTNTIKSSFYNELDDLSKLSEENRTVLNNIKAKVLNVTLDEDSCDVTGATKTGTFTTSTIALTGTNSTYSAFVLNGELLANNDIVNIGYRNYKVTLGNNKITLTKQANEVMWGGSEHFVELNPGHDELMNATTLSPMCTELGLGTIRLDIYFENLFTITSENEVIIKKAYANKIQAVLDELKTNGGVTEFLAVFWVAQPYGFKTWEGSPWGARTCPDPVTQADWYLKWLKLNGECARVCASLFPDIDSYEIWNEPEIMGGVDCPLCRPDGTDYTSAEKAKILTDLGYYYYKGIRESNPDAVLSTPSICCAQSTSDARFPVTTVNFLELMYAQIKDNTPVPGCELDTNPNNYFQAINCHPYLILGVTTKNWTTFINNLHNVCVTNGDGGTPIWVTEFGFAQNRTKNYTSDFLNVLGQAKNIEYLTRFYFYKVHDYTDKIDTDRWGLYNYDGTIKDIGTQVKNYINSSN